jgi:hypothetical protein
MPGEVLRFFVNLVEVIAAVAAVLTTGLLVTMAGLWILPRILGVTAEPLENSDLDLEAIPPHPEDDCQPNLVQFADRHASKQLGISHEVSARAGKAATGE